MSPVAAGGVERMAPVQGYSAGIPWSLHLEAYDVYCKRHGRQKALIEGGCRGGFGTEELDEYIPGWRERASEIFQLRAELTAAQAEADRLRVDADRYVWLRTNADYVMISWDDAHSLEGPIFFDDALIDAAIHAAKTEQKEC